MPALEDWTSTPLTFVDKAFATHVTDGAAWPQNIQEFFNSKMNETKNFASINETPNHMLIDGQVVKFRCMIQDMFDPEIFMDKLQIKNLATGELRTSTCRYRETLDLAAQEEIVHDEQVKHGERLSFYCVSVPGERPWIRDAYVRQEPLPSFPSTSESSTRSKRSLDEDDDVDQDNHEPSVEAMETDDSAKKAKPEQVQKPVKPIEKTSLNFPIPDAKGQAAIVKLYDIEEGTFKLNEMIEFTGIVSLNPMLGSGLDPDVDPFNKPELEAKNPPPSLIPRIHVLKYSKLNHVHPGLPQDLQSSTCLWEEMRRSRDELHDMFSKIFGGDGLVADYMICHLISQVYVRQEGLSLGKFSLNIFGLPISGPFTAKLSTLLQLILSKSHYFAMTIQDLNNARFLPKKDYATNRLTTGLLQLSPGTHLILDETKLDNGQLNAQGIENLTSLGHVIKFQSLDYDFGFHKINFETDIPCLILSEGRSMLPQDCQIMLKTSTANDLASDSAFDAAARQILENAERLRKYLILAKNIDFELTPQSQSMIQEDFVQERQSGQLLKTSDDLHSTMVLARLLALSRGEKSLNGNLWNQAKEMEIQRKQRAAHLPNRMPNSM